MSEQTHHYLVTWKEYGKRKEYHQECWVRSEQEAIKIYGLDEPDIEEYKIEEI